jgi:hypothetical protein
VTPIVSAAARLQGRVIARRELAATQRRAMFDLLQAHFSGVDRATFEGDLDEKNFVILLDDQDRVLRGFSTLLVYASTARPGTTVVYSGDTIVEREWWGSPALPATWLRAVREVAPRYRGRDVCWLLLTSGFRTYRFLPVFFRSFYPRHDCPAQSEQRLALDVLARERFGDRYDAARGIVRLERPQVLVRELLEVPEGRAVDPHVGYFLRRNPGYVHGDELACLTSIDDSNLTAAARRIARNLDRP